MEEIEGLAAMSQGAPQGRRASTATVEQAMQLLQSGRAPEELVQMGIPAEVVQMAIQRLPQVPQAPVEEGLAGRYVNQSI